MKISFNWNESVINRVKLDVTVIDIIWKDSMQRFGHVSRMEPDRLPARGPD